MKSISLLFLLTANWRAVKKLVKAVLLNSLVFLFIFVILISYYTSITYPKKHVVMPCSVTTIIGTGTIKKSFYIIMLNKGHSYGSTLHNILYIVHSIDGLFSQHLNIINLENVCSINLNHEVRNNILFEHCHYGMIIHLSSTTRY